MPTDNKRGPSMDPPYWYCEAVEPDPVAPRDVDALESLARLHGQTEGFVVGFGLALFLGLCAWLSS